MKATGFRLENTVNPETAVEGQRIVVSFDNAKRIKLFNGDKSIEETVKEIKANRSELLGRVVVLDGEFGPYCMFSRAELVEEL